ncbi:MAG TPA: F0F1 ATP synthase subunit A [Candidatus Limnocylindrales bacterium]|nr:F0F1 ATP synthase subunit A [Candidatus Limnocylindrales bacterium]
MIPVVFAAEKTPHVSLAPEAVFSLFGFPITNSLITGIFGYGLLFAVMFYVAGKVKRGEKNRFVSAIQWAFEGLYSTVQQVTGDKVVAKRLMPLAVSLFFFILVQYWLGVLPIVGPITWNGVPLFRGLAADLNTTFALAIITIVMAQVYAIRMHGFGGNLSRYFRNPFRDVAGAFEGVLELIAEFSRLMGLSLRLFGNVFAGEVLLMMIAFLTVYATPIALPPFMAFELFIGAVQAYIFFMLTVVFISLGLAGHGDHGTDSERILDHSTPDASIQRAAAAHGK